jgi:tripartite-type tricarboxylate transporter receptor subunit TctC
MLYASAGNGTPPHLAAELFKHMTGTNIVHIPYKGNAQAMTDLIAGQVSLSFPTIPSALPHVQAGKLRALGVTSARRTSALPEVPTIAEAGVPGYEGSAWYGVLAPAGTPQGIIDRLENELRNTLRLPELRDKLIAQGLEPVANTSADFAAVIAMEITKWSKVVAAAGAKVE